MLKSMSKLFANKMWERREMLLWLEMQWKWNLTMLSTMRKWLENNLLTILMNIEKLQFEGLLLMKSLKVSWKMKLKFFGT